MKTFFNDRERIRTYPDPGTQFQKDNDITIDIVPSFSKSRLLCPRAIPLDNGAYRLYFMEHRYDCPTGVIGEIVSAFSQDGFAWEREAGVRIPCFAQYAENRVMAPDIIRMPDGTFRMYFEGRTNGVPEIIVSAFSKDGLLWNIDPGVRLKDESHQIGFGTPCCVQLPHNQGWRMYFHALSKEKYEIWSAVSMNALDWKIEPGVRISQTRDEEKYAAYSPFVIPLLNGQWRMYYGGWASQPALRGCILSAVSSDGIVWEKESSVILEPDNLWDSVHCSEPCLLHLKDGRWRLFYEACDENDSWRILGAISK